MADRLATSEAIRFGIAGFLFGPAVVAVVLFVYFLRSIAGLDGGDDATPLHAFLEIVRPLIDG